jgi:hypothetical protein
MSSIPANLFVNVNPEVLNAGGAALSQNALFVSNNSRIPIGQILSFPDPTSVSGYFGAGSREASLANGGANLGSGYFGGFLNATQVPNAMLFAQFNMDNVGAFIRGGPINVLTIPQIQALSGTLAIVVDGYSYSGSVTLSAATSYSAAAAIIQTALNGSLPAAAAFTGSIAAGTASVTGSISGNVLTVSAVASGVLVAGAVIAGTGVTSGTQIDAQLSGVTGGVGTYAVSKSQVVASVTITATYGTLTVTAVASGTLSIGQTVAGGATSAGTQITALGTGAGLTGTYIVNLTQTVASGSLTASGSALAVTYDSVSGGLVITSGSRGAQSTIAYATNAIATSLLLTSASGAILSQGAAAATPGTFMASLTNSFTNFISFTTTFDPDGSAAGGNVQKQNFAGWVNGTNDLYAYICFDADPSPTLNANAAASLGRILGSTNSSGTILVWEPSYYNYAAFVGGMIASINYGVTNGRITLAYKGQTGLVATVTDPLTYTNLIANGYNAYCAVATAAQSFLLFQRGVVTGPFQWADSYVDQIVFNAALQLAILELLANINSIPYNSEGYGLLAQAMGDPIAMALNSGIIRKGVTLSSQQTLLVNNAAGGNVAPLIQQQGYAIVIQPASPQTRQARQSPGCFVWWTDGESIQVVNLTSVLIQ